MAGHTRRLHAWTRILDAMWWKVPENYGENALEEQYVFLKSQKVYEFRIGNNMDR